MNNGFRDSSKFPGADPLEKMTRGFAHPGFDKPKQEVHWPKPSHSGGAGRARSNPASTSREDQTDEERFDDQRASTTEPEKPVDRKVVRITNIHWETKKAVIGESARFTMDVDIPLEYSALTRITCGLEQQTRGGTWKPVHAEIEECHAKDGRAICDLRIPEPLPSEEGSKHGKPILRPVAKHSYSDQALGPEIEVEPGKSDPFESVIYYSPVRDKYLCFESELDFDSIVPEIDLMFKLQGLSQNVYQAKDESERNKAKSELGAETEKLFEEEVVGKAEPAVEELLLVRKNKRWGEKAKGWVYIRPYAKKNKTEVKGHWRKDNDATLKKNLDDLLKKAPGSKEHSPFFENEYKAKLFQTDPLKGQKLLWSGTRKGGNEESVFSWNAEAAVCRLAGNFTAGSAEVDLKEKKIKIGSEGSVSFGILEGKAEGKWALPPKGVNVLGWLEKTSYSEDLILKGRECLMRLYVTFGASGFAGLSIHGALNLLDLDLKREKPKSGREGGPHVTSEGSGEAFAGAQAGGELSLAAQWSPGKTGKFEELGKVGYDLNGSAGIGGKAEFTISYRNGTFHIKVGVGLTVGLGCKGGFAFDLGLEQGYHFIGHLFDSIDYHFVTEITGEAFLAYKNYAFTLMTLGLKYLAAEKAEAVDVITNFEDWISGVGDRLIDVKAALFDLKNSNASLAKVPPEAIGAAILTIMGGIARESTDLPTILSLLRSTTIRSGTKGMPNSIGAEPGAKRNGDNHKLRWTLRAVSGFIGSGNEQKAGASLKEEALHSGIRKIQDYGLGVGLKNTDGTQARPDRKFLDDFNALTAGF